MLKSNLSAIYRQFVRIITFIDLPINRKFTLFSFGVFFWLLALALVSTFTLVSIDAKYSRIVQQTLPHEQVAQKVKDKFATLSQEAAGLYAAGEPAEVLRHGENALASLEEIRKLGSLLALGEEAAETRSNNAGRKIEGLAMVSVSEEPEGVAYLRGISRIVEQIGGALREMTTSKVAQLQSGATQSEAAEAGYAELKSLLKEAEALSAGYSGQMVDAYRRATEAINETIRYAFVIMLSVLILALALLGVFTHWIADAIAQPIQAIISQIHSLGTGEVDLSQKIAITSKDEIGTLSAEFNALMETVYGMTTFKNVIEEDSNLHDIYARLGGIFEKSANIETYCIYEIKDNQHDMVAVYPELQDDVELRCKVDIMSNCELCRARKTGHQISSFAYPGVCLQFKPDADGQQHICVPVNVGGRIGAVVQFLFSPVGAERLDSAEIQAQVDRAEAYLKQAQSVLEAKRLLSALRESALKDALTGLYNRRFLQDHSQQIIAGVKRRHKRIGLLMCDLDYFKQVNDEYGHETGDLLLRETSAALLKTVRESDYVIRFGGEEFLVLLVDVEDGDAEFVAEKIRSAVSGVRIRTSSGALAKTISIGVSIFPADAETFWQAIKYADVALYKAKEAGRNRVVRFKPEMWSGESF